MRINLGKKSYFWPLPVTVIGSYDENGKADAMTAAYATLYDYNLVFISMELSHKTADNIRRTKAFTVAFATDKTMVQADYVGLVSAHIDPDKVAKSHLACIKSETVNAPLFTDFPVSCECKLISMDDGNVIGEIVNVSVDDKYYKDNKIDIDNIHFISFEPSTQDYKVMGKTIGKSHSIGKQLFNK